MRNWFLVVDIAEISRSLSVCITRCWHRTGTIHIKIHHQQERKLSFLERKAKPNLLCCNMCYIWEQESDPKVKDWSEDTEGGRPKFEIRFLLNSCTQSRKGYIQGGGKHDTLKGTLHFRARREEKTSEQLTEQKIQCTRVAGLFGRPGLRGRHSITPVQAPGSKSYNAWMTLLRNFETLVM